MQHLPSLANASRGRCRSQTPRIVIATGFTFTDGFEYLLNDGDEPVTIRSVSMIDTPPALEPVDVSAGDGRALNFQFDPEFPPARYDTGPLVPAGGAVLEQRAYQDGPMEGHQLLMGFRVLEPGRLGQRRSPRRV